MSRTNKHVIPGTEEQAPSRRNKRLSNRQDRRSARRVLSRIEFGDETDQLLELAVAASSPSRTARSSS